MGHFKRGFRNKLLCVDFFIVWSLYDRGIKYTDRGQHVARETVQCGPKTSRMAFFHIHQFHFQFGS